eukprot:TRINITY_DN5182_c0_g1_i1.p1 TRINITY_DN5182_c0_g1~~TRINITY_DN5182_c0_g1_i1.p1  ORF type:complete len:146 (-),score=9.03 TRINITY_DN5182_c0_g1_i1:30-467(-)
MNVAITPASQPREEKWTKIIDIRPYQKSINVEFIVLEKGQITKTKENNIMAHALVADASACVNLSLWDTDAEWMQPGDIFQLRGGYSTLFKNSLVLYSGKRHGSMERTGEFTMLFVESPNISQFSWVPSERNPNELVPGPAPTNL